VDAVVVATGPEAHLQPTITAFEAGKHVLVEKPVAVNAGQLDAMLAARTGGLIGACCSSRFRSTPGAHAAEALLASGKLGPVRRLSCEALNPPPASYDGTSPFFLHRPGWGGQGVLADWGCYDLDYLLGLCGWELEPRVVLAETGGLPEHFGAIAPPVNDVEVWVTAQALLTGGATLHYHRAAFAAVDGPRGKWRIECEGGALDLNMLTGVPQVVAHRFDAGAAVTEVLVDEAYEWPAIHRGPVIDFVEAVLGEHAPLTSLDQALIAQRLTDAIYASARTGGAVECGR